MKTRFLFTLALCAVAEWYSFILMRSVLKSVPALWRGIGIAVYCLLTAGAWISVLFIKQIDWDLFPSMVRNLIIAFVMGWFIGKLLIASIMILDDLRRLFLWTGLEILPKRKATSLVTGNGITRSAFLKKLALLISASTVGGFVYGISNRYNYQVKRIKIPVKGLPAALSGIKILQLSDIHVGSFDDREAVMKGVALAMEERPDLIFFTGDLVNNKTDELFPYMDVFSQLKAPLGVYSVLGNHDYGDYFSWPSAAAKKENLESMIASHAQMGWKLLMNEHVVLEKNGAKFSVIGVENWSAKPQFPRHGNLTKAMQGIQDQDSSLNILLSHDPTHWDAEVRPRFPEIGLTLSGHTHGMQFGIEIPGFKWSPAKFVYARWAGLYQQGAQYLYVNRGFGFLGYPGRIGILPEITVLELVPA